MHAPLAEDLRRLCSFLPLLPRLTRRSILQLLLLNPRDLLRLDSLVSVKSWGGVCRRFLGRWRQKKGQHVVVIVAIDVPQLGAAVRVVALLGKRLSTLFTVRVRKKVVHLLQIDGRADSAQERFRCERAPFVVGIEGAVEHRLPTQIHGSSV